MKRRTIIAALLAISTAFSVTWTSTAVAKTSCLARPLMTATICEDPPVIDGIPDDAAWKQASRSRFAERPGDLPNYVRICRDSRMLYVAVSCREPHMSTMDRSMETVEVFFAPDDKALERVTPNLTGYYYRFAVTADGAHSAEHGDVNSNTRHYKPWQGKWTAAVGRRDDGWDIEIAISMADFGKPLPPDVLWGYALARHRHNQNGGYSAVQWWSPLVMEPDLRTGGLHTVYFTHMLGLLRFAERGAIVEDEVGDYFPGRKRARLTAFGVDDAEVIVRTGRRIYNGEGTSALGDLSQAMMVRTRLNLKTGEPTVVNWQQPAGDEAVNLEVISRSSGEVFYSSGQRYRQPVTRDRIWEEIEYSDAANTLEEELKNAVADIEASEAPFEQRLQNWQDTRDSLRQSLATTRTEQLLRHGPRTDGKTAYGIGLASTMTKIMPKAITFGRMEYGSRIALQAARNEMEAAQVVVYSPDQQLREVTLVVSDLVGESGARIDSESVWAAPVGFVKTTQPSQYEVPYVGWWPDPILTYLKTFDIGQGDLQPVWYSVRVPREATPGIYRGTLTIRPANSVPAVIPVDLEVWDFTLPREASLNTAVNVGAISGWGNENPSPERLADLQDSLDRYLINHRCNPDQIYRRTPPDERTIKRWAEIGVTSFNIFDIRHNELDPGFNPNKVEFDEIQRMISRTLAIAEKYGIADRAYVYLPDEAGSEHFARIEEIASRLKTAFPGLRLGTTEKLWGPLKDESAAGLPFGAKSGRTSIDWVCVTTPGFNDTAWVDHVHKAGREAWWYTATGPYKPYADLNIEDPGVDLRLLLGFMSFAYKVDGFLYWSLMVDSDRHPQNKSMTDGPFTAWNPQTWPGHNGVGQLIYPGQNDPVTSLRMENWLDGMEDYEYLALARKRIEELKMARQDKRADKLEQALTPYSRTSNEIFRGLTDYTRDPDVIKAARLKLAQAILDARDSQASSDAP